MLTPFFLQNFRSSLSANFTKVKHTQRIRWQFLPTNCLSVFDHFMGLALKGLEHYILLHVDVIFRGEITVVWVFSLK